MPPLSHALCRLCCMPPAAASVVCLLQPPLSCAYCHRPCCVPAFPIATDHTVSIEQMEALIESMTTLHRPSCRTASPSHRTRRSSRFKSPEALRAHRDCGKDQNRSSYAHRSQSFPNGATKHGLSVCAVCLGHHAHKINQCNSETLWDESKAWACRSSTNQLIGEHGRPLCYDWQRPQGCQSTSHCHECSGCGRSDHGTQKCHRAQKA